MFGARLKDLRKQHGYTQKALAEILGLERSAIGKYEAGAAMPTDETKLRLAKLFNVSMDYLLCLSDIPEPPGAVEPDDDIKQLLRVVYMLNRSGRRLTLDYATMLADKDEFRLEKDTQSYA